MFSWEPPRIRRVEMWRMRRCTRLAVEIPDSLGLYPPVYGIQVSSRVALLAATQSKGTVFGIDLVSPRCIAPGRAGHAIKELRDQILERLGK